MLRRLRKDLRLADRRLIVSMSNSSDPYPPEEKELGITRESLRLLLSYGFKVLIITKGSLVTRDLDLIRRGEVTVSVTVTTLDEGLSKLLEPGAPPPSERIEALRKLSRGEVPVSARVDPVIPSLNDEPRELEELVGRLADAGVSHVVTSTYKAKPDSLKRLITAFPQEASYLKRIYREEGLKFRGYRYLRKELREKLLRPVVKAARYYGLTYATCREGLTSKEFFNAPSCDGSHLITLKRRGLNLA